MSNNGAEKVLSALLNRVLFGELSPREAAVILPADLGAALHRSPP